MEFEEHLPMMVWMIRVAHLKVIKTAYAKRIPMFKGLHRFLPAMILLQNGKIIQIPVQHFPRIAGQAKFGLWNRLLGPLADCFAYLWMKKKYINYTVAKKVKCPTG